MPRRQSRSTLVLLDAMVFLDIARQELIADRHPAMTKLLGYHKLIMNKRLKKHYSGVLYKRGESALRYIDSVIDVAPLDFVSPNEASSIRLNSRHRPTHSKDSFICQIAIAARRRSNDVILVSEDPHLNALETVYNNDFGISIVSANNYVQRFCSK